MDRKGFKNRMKQYKKAREENPGLKYYDFMERLAEFKAKEWNDDPDMVLQHMLNDNSYNYQQMYEDNPNFDIKEGHFVDTYKTAYHPTFSEESMYSGKKSPYNPEGIVGGSWDESTKSFYLNDKRQSKRKAQNYLNYADPGYRAIPKYYEGGEVGTPSVGMADFNTKFVNLLGEIYTKGLSNTIKRRLYDNLIPYNYGNDAQGVTGRIVNSVWKNKQEVLPSEYNYDIMRDDIFAEYLGIPLNRRHDITDIMGNDANDKKHLVIPSKYKPTKQTDSNVEYKTINKIKDQDILKATNFNYGADDFPIDPLEFNENRTVHGGGLEYYFGNYTVSRGVDPVKGEYRSFYDLWDLNPFYGKHASNPDNTVEKILNKISGNKDASLGIGKPIEFYDRVYLDDYYNINSSPKEEDYYGGYLPEITVTPTKYAEGGEVEPDPLEVLERSKPKFHGIPLAKGNIDGVFSPIDVPLATLPKVWPVVNKWLPNYGQMLGALVGGDDGLTVNRKSKPLTTKQIDTDVKEHYEDIVIPLRPQEDYIKLIYLQNPDNFSYNVYADNALPDNRLADFNNATGEVRIKESILNSPISSQILAHEINGHRSDRSLPRSKEAKATIDKAFNVRKKPLSKESKLLAEKEAETTRLSYNFYKYMKDNGLLLVKKPMTKTKAYQDYVLNATDDQIDAMLGNNTVYSRDYKASGIDYDKIRWALAYAPEIAAGLIIPQHLLSNDNESKQWI